LSFGDKDLVIVAIAHNGLSFGDKDLVVVAIRRQISTLSNQA
jgi:hypothetical protein